MKPKRFPKIKSPFNREENNANEYVVYDEVTKGYDWVFENEEVKAVEKIDGTNCAVVVDNGSIESVWTRYGSKPFQRVATYGSPTHHHIVRAVQNSIQRDYLDLDEGVHYGEAVGVHFQGNPHELSEDLFLPFNWLVEHCQYESWGKYPKDYETIEKWFRDDLFSLFYSKMHGVDLDTASVSNGTYCEGIMFVHPDYKYTEDIESVTEQVEDGTEREVGIHFAKLRRDMYEWYDGERH